MVELVWKALFGDLKFAPLCVMCLLWREMNNHTFEARERSKNQLEDLLICTLFDWSRVWGLTNSNTLIDFIDSFCYCS